MNIPVGPVAVFAASNFPLAFSVAGGDTASAFADGCPVIVKAHNVYLGTSELVGRAIQQSVISCRLPLGTFSLLFGEGNAVGYEFVIHPLVAAVGFTGSRAGDLALLQAAQNARTTPIPVFAEMSSINPVRLLQGALQSRCDHLVSEFVASVVESAGQLCTNPGLVIAMDSPELTQFVTGVSALIQKTGPQHMLFKGILSNYLEGQRRLKDTPNVTLVSRGKSIDSHQACASVYMTTAENFLKCSAVLSREIFGATSLIVKVERESELYDIIGCLEG